MSPNTNQPPNPSEEPDKKEEEPKQDDRAKFLLHQRMLSAMVKIGIQDRHLMKMQFGIESSNTIIKSEKFIIFPLLEFKSL
jgi:hypothetical protein